MKNVLGCLSISPSLISYKSEIVIGHLKTRLGILCAQDFLQFSNVSFIDANLIQLRFMGY